MGRWILGVCERLRHPPPGALSAPRGSGLADDDLKTPGPQSSGPRAFFESRRPADPDRALPKKCHGPSKQRKGGLRLDSKQAPVAGVATGQRRGPSSRATPENSHADRGPCGRNRGQSRCHPKKKLPPQAVADPRDLGLSWGAPLARKGPRGKYPHRPRPTLGKVTGRSSPSANPGPLRRVKDASWFPVAGGSLRARQARREGAVPITGRPIGGP